MIKLREPYSPPILRSDVSRLLATTSVGSEHAEVGAGTAKAAGAVLFYGAYALASGAFSYALYTGKYIFETKHPVWGTIFALSTLSAIWAAGDKLSSSEA